MRGGDPDYAIDFYDELWFSRIRGGDPYFGYEDTTVHMFFPHTRG
ncbi:hypothetical protein HMPREF3190_01688 [Umbribacter vaginalis]|nr:hypothetical protein HMPREF3190_01688 [Coriobacteriales bacterium DNF00809]